MEAATVRIASTESWSHYDSVFWFPASIFPLIAASYSGFLFLCCAFAPLCFSSRCPSFACVLRVSLFWQLLLLSCHWLSCYFGSGEKQLLLCLEQHNPARVADWCPAGGGFGVGPSGARCSGIFRLTNGFTALHCTSPLAEWSVRTD